jgi:hypothetical protein
MIALPENEDGLFGPPLFGAMLSAMLTTSLNVLWRAALFVASTALGVFARPHTR